LARILHPRAGFCDVPGYWALIGWHSVDDRDVGEKTSDMMVTKCGISYSALRSPVLVGIEATGSMQWFLRLMEELGIAVC